MAEAEGAAAIGHTKSAPTMTQDSAGNVSGPTSPATSHTPGGNPKADTSASGYQQFDEGAEDSPDYSDMGDSATDDEGEDDDAEEDIPF